MDEIITRYTSEHETEIIERGGQREITGYASVFFDGTANTEYKIGDNLYERINRSAFDRPLAQHQNTEVRYNHSQDFVLATVETGAVIRTDEKGLRYSIPYDPQDPQHQTVKSKGEKGVIRESSFQATKPTYRYAEDNGKHIAWLTSVKDLL